jgi:hypothetical protein
MNSWDLEMIITRCIGHGGFAHGNWVGFCPACRQLVQVSHQRWTGLMAGFAPPADADTTSTGTFDQGGPV